MLRIQEIYRHSLSQGDALENNPGRISRGRVMNPYFVLILSG